MTDGTVKDEAPIRSLAALFEKDTKRFEWMAKQYYDLFAYHAAQRLTAFNFFLVSLSFFSTAYATLIARSEVSGPKYYSVGAALAFAAYLLVVAFGRLDKRNEQIININEKPLIRIQRAIRLGLADDGSEGDEVWETFVQADRSYRGRTFGDLLPVIYTLAATACAAGAVYGFTGPGDSLDPFYFTVWLLLAGAAFVLIKFPLGPARAGSSSLREASLVTRPSAPVAPAQAAPAANKKPRTAPSGDNDPSASPKRSNRGRRKADAAPSD